MGRTLPTQIQLLHEAQEEWKGFRRALRKEEQDAFDQAWGYARRFSTAASMAERPLPFEAHVMAMLVGIIYQQQISRKDHDQEKSDSSH